MNSRLAGLSIDRIGAVLDRRGWTWRDLAEKAGMGENRLWHIRNGLVYVRLCDVQSIARALDIRVEDLVESDPRSGVA